MTDQAVNTVWSADYLPFGQADVTLATVENNLRFAGQYYDSETGLHYNLWRYYDPKIGRYLRPDPSHSLGQLNESYQCSFSDILLNPQEKNLYHYVQNNPINAIDPEGLASQSCSGYLPYFGSTCTDDSGNSRNDPYPRNAYKCCNDFVKKYNGSKAVDCVAVCLTQNEAECQSKPCCSDRSKCRIKAHFECYWKCKFVPIKGIPGSCRKIVLGR